MLIFKLQFLYKSKTVWATACGWSPRGADGSADGHGNCFWPTPPKFFSEICQNSNSNSFINQKRFEPQRADDYLGVQTGRRMVMEKNFDPPPPVFFQKFFKIQNPIPYKSKTVWATACRWSPRGADGSADGHGKKNSTQPPSIQPTPPQLKLFKKFQNFDL